MPTLKRGKVATKETGTSIADLCGDWFDRDPKTFTKVSAEHHIEWDDEPHSAFMLKGRPHGWNLLEQSYKMVKGLLTAMDLPNRFNLRFHKRDSFTDGKSIYVSTQVLDEHELLVEQRVDVLLGLGTHEGCHIKYTNMPGMQAWQKTLPVTEAHIIFSLFNILEDERIEQELGNDMPGLVRYLVPMKYYYFEELYERELTKLKASRRKEREKSYREALKKALAEDADVLPEKPADTDDDSITDLNAFERLMNTFMAIVRYPKNLNPMDIAYFGKYIVQLKALLTPYPDSTEAAQTCAENVWALFKEFYKAPPAPPEKEPGEEDDEEGPRIIFINGSGGDSADEGESYTPRPGDIIIDLKGESAGPLTGDILTDAGKLTELLDKLMRHSVEEGKDFGPEAREVAASDFPLSVLEGDGFEGSVGNVFFRKQYDNERSYRASRERIMPYVAALRKSLNLHNQQFVRTLRGMRTGPLDEQKLVEAFMGVPTVHLQHQKVRTDHVAIGILIDQSSSMGGSNMQAAIDGAVLLNEALCKVGNIELFIYGHTGDITNRTSTDLYVYSEPNHRPKYALGSARAVSQNRDGVAILECGKRMRQFTRNNGVLFVLSDGAPCASGYYGHDANADTKHKVQMVEHMGFSVVQIAIESHVPSEEMFNKFVTFTDLTQLARQMGQLVKSLALAKAKVHIE